MKREAKVAWPKEHPVTQRLREAITRGTEFALAEIAEAIDDRDGMVIFDPVASNPLAKSDHVIFQYGVFLQRADGRVAVFQRAEYEEGGPRMNAGRSVLVSRSMPDEPFGAIPRIIEYELCTGGRKIIKQIEPVGLALNEMPPKGGRARPTYGFALYRHQFPEGLPLHGRFKTSPDRFIEWVAPEDLPSHLSHSGLLDQFIGHSLARGGFEASDADDDILFSPTARIVGAEHPLDQFKRLEYTHGKNVFLSHAAEDAFSAYALFRLLIDESSRKIYPTIDLDSIKDGDRLQPKIERLIKESDCLVLIITPNLIEKARERAKSGDTDWVQEEVKIAKRFGKPIIGFKLGRFDVPDYISDEWVANNRDSYTDWLNEVTGLIENIQQRFSPP